VRKIVEAFQTQRQLASITLVDAAEDYTFATDARTRAGVDRLITLRENIGSFNRFLPLLAYHSAFIYFHDDDMLPGPQLLQTFLQIAQEHPTFGVLGQDGRIFEDEAYSAKSVLSTKGVTETDFVVRGYFVRREVLSAFPDWLNRLGILPRTEDDLFLCTAARLAGWRVGVIAPRTREERMNQEEMPSPYALSQRPEHASNRTKFIHAARSAGWQSLSQLRAAMSRPLSVQPALVTGPVVATENE
jgi:hypothetical protein